MLWVATVDSTAVQEIAGVELDTRFGGQHFHDPTTGRVFNTRGGRKLSVLSTQHIIVVVASGLGQLGDPFSDFSWLDEIQWCVFDPLAFSFFLPPCARAVCAPCLCP